MQTRIETPFLEHPAYSECRPPRAVASGSIAVLDGAPDHGRLVELLERAVARHPRLRERPVGRRGRRAEWVATPDFDLAFHLRWETIENDRELLTRATQRHTRPFARLAPPWEVHVLAGPSRALVLLRLDPRLEAAGLGEALLASLLDAEPEPEAPRFPPDEPRSPATTLLETLDALVPRALALRDATRTLLDVARQAAATSGELARAMLEGTRRQSSAWPEELATAALRTARALGALVTERLTENSALSRLASAAAPRAIALVDLPLAALDAVRRPLGLTLEALVLSISSGAVSRLEQARGGALPRTLRALISLPETRDTGLLLPLDVQDPLERAAHFHEVLASLGGRARQAAVKTLAGAMTALPLALAQGLSQRGAPRYDLALAYRELPFGVSSLAGARVRRLYPLAAGTGATGLVVGAHRFDRWLTIGLTYDARVVGSGDELVAAWRASCNELLDAGLEAAARAGRPSGAPPRFGSHLQ